MCTIEANKQRKNEVKEENRENTYTQQSRAKKKCKVFIRSEKSRNHAHTQFQVDFVDFPHTLIDFYIDTVKNNAYIFCATHKHIR